MVTSGSRKGYVALGLYRKKPNAEERLWDLSQRGFMVDLDVRSRTVEEPACESGPQYASN